MELSNKRWLEIAAVVFVVLEGLLVSPLGAFQIAPALAVTCTNSYYFAWAQDSGNNAPYGVSAYQTVYGSELCGNSNNEGSTVAAADMVEWSNNDFVAIGVVTGYVENTTTGSWYSTQGTIHFYSDWLTSGTYTLDDMSSWSGYNASSQSSYNFTVERQSGESKWETFVMIGSTTLTDGSIKGYSDVGSFTEVQLESHNYYNIGSAYFSSIGSRDAYGTFSGWTNSAGYDNAPYAYTYYSETSYYFYRSS